MKRYAWHLSVASALLLFSAPSFAADADVQIWKSGPPSAVAGTDVVYEISVYNSGPDPATGVTVEDVFSLPPVGEGEGGAATCSDGIDNDGDDAIDRGDSECEGLIFVGSTAACLLTGSTAEEGTLDCALGTIGVGETRSFSVSFHVSPAYRVEKGDAITNRASVTATEDDPNPGNNNSDLIATAVEEIADLRITKYVEPDAEILAGQPFTYTIWVDNLGPSAASNVWIRDTLLNSGDVTIQSCAFSVSQGGGIITQFTCTTGSVVQTQFGSDVGTFRTNILYPLTPSSEGRLRGAFRLTANNAVNVTNTSRVSSVTYDPDMANNFAEVGIDVIPVVDLGVVAMAMAEVQVNGQVGRSVDTTALPAMPEPDSYVLSATEVTAGRRIEVSATATNAGPSTATNVLIEFLLPAGATVLGTSLDANPGGGASGTCFTEPAGEPRRSVICQYGTLAKDGTATARFQVLVDHHVPHGTPLSIDLLTTAQEFDPELGNNPRSLPFVVNTWADRSLTKFAIGSPVAGTDMHYELQIANRGPSTARNLVLRDFLPNGMTFLDAFIVHGGTPLPPLPCGLTVGSNAIFCDLGDVPPTGPLPILVFFNVHVQSQVPPGTLLTNTADVFQADTPDPLSSDNSDTTISMVTAGADLELIKTATADVYAPSEGIVFILTVTNKGPSTAQNVVVVDTLPSARNATYVTDSGGCALAGEELTCGMGNLLNGESKSINVYMLPKGKKGTVTNTAEVGSDTHDHNISNNTSSKSVLITGGRVTKSRSK